VNIEEISSMTCKIRKGWRERPGRTTAVHADGAMTTPPVDRFEISQVSPLSAALRRPPALDLAVAGPARDRGGRALVAHS
jgi:hypothetical protein